jgi:hypothetical protein
MSVLQHPTLIASWDRARWLVGWILPSLFAVVADLCVQGATGNGARAAVGAVVVFAAAYLVEVLYVEQVSGAMAEALGLLGDVACVLAPWAPLIGVQWALIGWTAGSAILAGTVLLTGFDVQPWHVMVGIGGSVMLAWIATRITIAAPPVGGLAGRLWVVVAVLLVVAGAGWLAMAVVESTKTPQSLPQLRGSDLERFLHEHACTLLDGPHPTPGHPDPARKQALYAVPRRFGAVRLAVVCNGTVNPATGEYEYIGVPVRLECRTVAEAVSGSYEQTPREYARTVRRT